MTKLQRYTIICIIFLAFLPLMYQFMCPCLTASQIFSNHFVAQKFLVTHEGFRNNVSAPQSEEIMKQKALYYEAIEAYSKEEYASTILLFERYLNQVPNNRHEVSLYLGIAYLETAQLNAAKKEFQFLLENGSIKKKQDAEWYLVLTLLKQEDVKQVRTKLTKMLTQKTSHAYTEKARTLLEEIQQQYQS